MVDYSTLYDFLLYFIIINFLLLILVFVLVMPEIIRLARPLLTRVFRKHMAPPAGSGTPMVGTSVEVILSAADRQVLEGMNAKLAVLSQEVGRLRQVIAIAASRGPEGNAVEEGDKDDETTEESAQEPALLLDPPSGSDALEVIRASYNPGVLDKSAREVFRARFSPVLIGVANSGERVKKPGTLPVFEINDGGDYFAVPIDSARYAVVPRFGLTFQDGNYGTGAMGEVFRCPGYRPSLRYPAVSVVKPAVFELEPGKGWTIKQTGELDLGQGVN